MSARAERGFTPALQEVERALAVPLPRRIQILLELESDLESLRRSLEAQGLLPEEARARAIDMLTPGGEALRELGRLHAPAYLRVVSRLPGGLVQSVERSALALSAAVVVALETAALWRSDLLRSPSPFLWVVLALGAALIALAAWKAFELWVKQDHRRPHRGVHGILVLAGLTLASGSVGVLCDTLRLSSALERSPQLAETLVMVWLVNDAALLAVAILTALFGAVAWFVIRHWLALVSSARLDALGVGPSRP